MRKGSEKQYAQGDGGGGSRSEFDSQNKFGHAQDNSGTQPPQIQTNQGAPDNDHASIKDNISTSNGHIQDIKRQENYVRSMYENTKPKNLSVEAFSDLQTIIDTWPVLPKEVKAGIMAMVKEIR